MPLRLFVGAEENFLMRHLLAGKGEASALNKRAKIVAVHSQVACVGRRLRFFATGPHKALNSLKLALSMLLKLLWIDCHSVLVKVKDIYLI